MLGFAFCTALAEGSQMQQRNWTKSAWGSTTGRTFKVEGKIRKRLVLFHVDYKSTANHYVGVLGSLTHEHTGLNCLSVIHRKPSERAWWSCPCPGWIEVMCTAFIHQPESSLVPVPNAAGSLVNSSMRSDSCCLRTVKKPVIVCKTKHMCSKFINIQNRLLRIGDTIAVIENSQFCKRK